MVAIGTATWTPPDFCFATRSAQSDDSLAEVAYETVCRTDFTAPGFCLIDLGPDVSSTALRGLVVDLKRALQQIHQTRQGRDLVHVSAGRFDQQATTKPHRDGGPDESLLMLGYEPSDVPAEIAMSDYARCAFDRGLTPARLLERHNPMFAPGEELLRPYTTRVTCFSHGSAQVVLINNSIAPYSSDGTAWQGVLHTATIHEPDDTRRRVVNSTMIASVPLGSREAVSAADLEEFLTTSVVRRRGYGTPDLDADV